MIPISEVTLFAYRIDDIMSVPVTPKPSLISTDSDTVGGRNALSESPARLSPPLSAPLKRLSQQMPHATTGCRLQPWYNTVKPL